MNAALLAVGLLAARLGLLLGTLPGPRSVAVGGLVIGAAIWKWRSPALACGLSLPPSLVAALVLAGFEPAFGASMAWGAALLLACGIAHSGLLLLAGALPCATSALMRRFASAQACQPGRRSLAVLLAAAGAWWVALGLVPEWANTFTLP
jgi:hypothetical protein